MTDALGRSTSPWSISTRSLYHDGRCCQWPISRWVYINPESISPCSVQLRGNSRVVVAGLKPSNQKLQRPWIQANSEDIHSYPAVEHSHSLATTKQFVHQRPSLGPSMHLCFAPQRHTTSRLGAETNSSVTVNEASLTTLLSRLQWAQHAPVGFTGFTWALEATKTLNPM